MNVMGTSFHHPDHSDLEPDGMAAMKPKFSQEKWNLYSLYAITLLVLLLCSYGMYWFVWALFALGGGR